LRILARYFHFDGRNTTFARELRGAVATFLTMAYILFVNPSVLANAGVPQHSAVACTALAAGICSILMGLIANFPIALASGMGLNAFVAFQVAPAAGSWQTAMGVVVLDGVLILLLVLAGLREAMVRAIPRELRLAIGAGIGLFIAFIGLVNARLVVVPPGTIAVLSKVDPRALLPPVTYGSLRDPATAVALVGLLITAVLFARKVTGAILIGILATTLVALVAKVSSLPQSFAAPSFEIAFQADVRGAVAGLFNKGLLPLLLAIMLVDFFDTVGTATAVAEEAGLHDENGQIPGLRRILAVDSVSASVGGFLGVSSVTSYIESAAGVAEGARTGLHSVLVGLMFLLAVFAAPLAQAVPPAATAPALILVGFLMLSQIAQIDFRDPEAAVPAFVTLLTVPLTFSISHGIGLGFLTYVAIKLSAGKWRQVHPMMYGAAALFAVYFLWV
jgi:AGZA family xanthine/uracil permease-like MFS transporter